MRSRRQSRAGTSAALPGRSANGRFVTDASESYRFLYELNPSPMWIFDEESLRFLAANEAALRLYGYSRREFLQLTVKDLRPIEDMAKPLAALDRQRKSRAAFVGVWRHRKKDGTVFDAEVTLSCIQFRGRTARLAMVNDITARKQAEEALRRERDRAQNYLGIAGVILVALNADETVGLINQRGSEVLGYPRSKIVGRNWFDHFVPAEDRERTRTAFVQLMAEKIELAEYFENRVQTRNGKVRLVAWHNIVLRDIAGRIIGTLSSGEDITARREAEEQLRTLARTLEQRVAERTAELEAANRALREEMARHQQLESEILNVSEREQRRIGQDLHDGLCQITTATAMMCEGLARDLRDQSRHGEARTARRITALIQSVGEEARRLSHGLSPVALEAEGLMRALESLALSTRNLFQVSCRFRCATPVLVADHAVAIHLFRIAQEAVNNAVRHGKPRQIGITLERNRAGLVLTIADDGRGLPRKPSEPGGMGMHVMRYRAGMIGGALRVERRSKRGTTVTCTVPGRAGEERASKRTASWQRSGRHPSSNPKLASRL
jgi:PAS domain S-box-containing protein